jgi:hypothetical protein
MLIQGFPLAGESFPAITIEEAMKFSPAPCLIHFGTHAPMAVFTHGDKKYYHPTQEIARKHVAAKARKARRAAIAEARRLLKEPELTATTQVRNSQPAEIQALEALNDASYSLSWSMRTARSRNKKNALRNYRRKRSNVKKLHVELSARVVRSTALKPMPHVPEFQDVVKEPYILWPRLDSRIHP